MSVCTICDTATAVSEKAHDILILISFLPFGASDVYTFTAMLHYIIYSIYCKERTTSYIHYRKKLIIIFARYEVWGDGLLDMQNTLACIFVKYIYHNVI